MKLWIGCDVCDKWYCDDCENLSLPPDVDIYMCVQYVDSDFDCYHILGS